MNLELVLDAPYITPLKSVSMAADVPSIEFDQTQGTGDVPYITLLDQRPQTGDARGITSLESGPVAEDESSVGCRKAAQPVGDVRYITLQLGYRVATLSHQEEVR